MEDFEMTPPTPEQTARYLRQSMMFNVPPVEGETMEERINKMKRLAKYVETGE